VAVTRVHSINMLSSDILELVLERDGIDFTPGDCVAISHADGTSRPYSVSSSVDDETLHFVIRRMPGGIVSEWIAERKAGDEIEISPPFGWFRPSRSGKKDDPSVFVATGTGIAPFLSALRSHHEMAPKCCLYGVRKKSDAVEIDYLQKRCPIRLCVSGEASPPHHRGRVTDLLKEIPMSPETHYYLCGLDAMIDEVSTWLEQHGVHFTRVHREVFFNA
jgi:ferredoxin--NADP+ reductase